MKREADMVETDGSSGPRFAGLLDVFMLGAGSKSPLTRDYIAAHAFLPPDPRSVPVAEIEVRGRRLFDPTATRDQKRAIMVLLAHHGSDAAVRLVAEYAANPDPDLTLFAHLALDEAALWAGYPAPVAPRGTCPCASGLPYKRCCGAD